MRSLIAVTRSDRLRKDHRTLRRLTQRCGPLAAGMAVTVLGLWEPSPGQAEELQALPMPPLVATTPDKPPTTTTTVTTTTTTPAAPAAPVAPAAPAAPAATLYQGQALPPPPLYIPPPPPLYTPPPPPPLYTVPYPVRTSCCANLMSPYSPYARSLSADRPPTFSVGVRFTAMGIGQKVFGNDMNLLGGGLQLRFRNRGHWGFETAFDVLGANINNGAFNRTSYPVTADLMLYLFRNRPENHFNIYALAGFGLVPDSVTLYSNSPQQLNQQFLELMGELGAGVELRFHRIALSADIRGIGLSLDHSSTAGSYYAGVSGGPIPNSSSGYKTNVSALIWF